MPELPSKLYFRRGEVRDIFGFSEESLTKLIRAQTLKPIYLNGDQRAYFARHDLQKLLPHTASASTPPMAKSVPPATHAPASQTKAVATEAQRTPRK
jgi:hypothetical protein